MRREIGIWFLFAALLLGSALPLAAAESWPTFRGANRSGVSPDTGLLQTWPEGGPKLLWDAAGVGRGYSSLAIADGRIITLGDGSSTADDKDEYLFAFDVEHGKPLWKTKIGAAWNEGPESWQSSRSTPTIDGPRVYVISPHGELVCCETETGKELWTKDLKKEFNSQKGDSWGYSESVLIDGNNLICTPGGEKATMVALNKVSGDVVWTASQPGNRGAGHASIVPADIGDTRVYVQTTASGAIGVRATDGKLLWNFDIDKTTAVIPTPIVRGDLVFFAAGYKRGGALLKQIAGENGDVKIETIYPITPALANKHGGIVLVGDYLFGDSDDGGIPFCADLMTGEIKWKKRGSGKGSAAMAAADGCLYIGFADGTVVLAKASPDEYTELSSFKVPNAGDRPSWAHPVIVNGKLFLRENDHILCYDLKAN